MKKIIYLFLLLVIFPIYGKNDESLFSKIKADHKNYYLDMDYKRTGYVFMLGALMANTNIDQQLIDFYNYDIHSRDPDEHDENSSFWKNFGEGQILIPISLLSASTNFISKNPVGDWGSLVSRAYLVGAPPMLLMQKVTGGSRPFELENNSSHWKFWNDENGVSGHAFISSVPFLVASKMVDNKFLSKTLLLASTFTAISRVNDNAHFTSQAILGWYMGYLSVEAVTKTEKNNDSFTFMPIVNDKSIGLSFAGKF